MARSGVPDSATPVGTFGIWEGGWGAAVGGRASPNMAATGGRAKLRAFLILQKIHMANMVSAWGCFIQKEATDLLSLALYVCWLAA